MTEIPISALDFWGFTPRDLTFLAAFIFGAGRIYQRLSAVEKKLNSFITKEVVAEKEKSAHHEHDAIRREIEDVADRLAVLEVKAMR